MATPRPAPRRLLAAAFPAALLVLSACTEPRVDKWRKDLARAEASWRAAGIRNYDMDVVRSCYCIEAQIRPVTVSVRNAAFVSIVYADTSGGTVDTTLFQQYLTMDRIFTLMSAVLDTEPSSLHAEYNATYGYPSLWGVDPDGQVAGEEFTIQVYGFRPTASALTATPERARPAAGRR